VANKSHTLQENGTSFETEEDKDSLCHNFFCYCIRGTNTAVRQEKEKVKDGKKEKTLFGRYYGYVCRKPKNIH